MTQSLTLVFESHIPSKKNSRSVGRNNIPLPSKAFQRWHKTELATLQDAPAIPSPVSITYEFWIGGKDSPREFDLSNAEESINDLLVDAGIIADDSWRHLVMRNSRVAGFVRGESRTVVTVQHVSEFESWGDAIALLKQPAELKRLANLRGMTQKALKDELWEDLTA